MKRNFLVHGLVMAGLLLAAVVPVPALAQSKAQAQVLEPVAPHPDAPASFADLSERLLPSVVNISTTQNISPQKGGRPLPDMPQFPPGSPFEEFFRDFMERHGGPDSSPQSRKITSLGSGFVIDPKGYVVTNNHVIQDADEITVILHDDTNLKAKVLGRDSKTDLALLKVEPSKPLTAVPWGDSDSMRVGDWIVAIGNPFGLGGTVTAGIISARARDINAGPYDDFLQTDASINRGNSGGPMFNLKGEVIGVNTAIFSPSGGSVGIGFAIPATMAKSVIAQLKEHGRTRRGWLGVRIQAVTEDIADSLGLKDSSQGALVASVTPDGPAAKAGIKAGDIILKFNDKSVNEMRRLPRVVAETPIGQKAPVVLWRKGREMTLNVTVGELETAEDEEEASVTEEDGQAIPEKTTEVLEMGLTALTPALRERHELDDSTKGVLVVTVKEGSAAEDIGLRPGDVIAEVGQEEVEKPEDVAKKIKDVKSAGRKTVLLLVNRKNDLRFVALQLGTEKK